VYLNQRARLASDMSLAGEPTAGAGRYPPSNPQEGTV
jgi:hypothetical protein